MAQLPNLPDLSDLIDQYGADTVQAVIDHMTEWRDSLDGADWACVDICPRCGGQIETDGGFGSYLDGIGDAINTAEELNS